MVLGGVCMIREYGGKWKGPGCLYLPIAAMAQKCGVSLHIGGDSARTNGKQIYIPALPDDNVVAAIKARGYVDHEAAHIRHTDFSVQNSKWTNIFEDIRIEKKQGSKYPGVAINTRELVDLLVKEGQFKADVSDPLGMLMVWASSRARHRILEQNAIAVREKEAEAYSRCLFGDGFSDQFAAIVDKVKDTKSTLDCKKLADEMESFLKQAAASAARSAKAPPDTSGSSNDPKDQRKQKQGKGKNAGKSGPEKSSGEQEAPVDESNQNDESEDDSSEGDSGGQPDQNTNQSNGQTGSSGQSSGQTESNDQNTGQTGESSQNPDQTGGGGLGAGSQPRGLQDLLNATTQTETGLGEILQSALNEEGGKCPGILAVPGTTITKTSDLTGSESGLFQNFQQEVLRSLQGSAKLRSQLQGLFAAQFLKHGFAVLTGQRIDKRSVHLIAAKTPDNRVFSARQERRQEDTAISIIVDASGSMMGSKMDLALRAAYASAKCIKEMAGVTCNVGAFPWINNTLLEVKPFGAKPDLKRFYEVSANGGTPAAEAILWAGQKLCLRKENRKMVIMFTDGAPDSYVDAAAAIKRIAKYGVELYVVALGSTPADAIDLASRWVDIKYVSPITAMTELGEAFIKLLRSTLVAKKKVA